MKKPLLLASSNSAKRERLRRVFTRFPLQLRYPENLQEEPDFQEEGSSHLAVACGKAVAWSSIAGDLTVATDGGVNIPALGAIWDSLTTRRSTGADASDEQRAFRLIRILRDYPTEAREAFWIEAIAVAHDGVLVAAQESQGLRGVLTDNYNPAPSNFRGFWVYGLWTFPQFEKRYWDLTEKEFQEVGDPWFNLQPWLEELIVRLVMPQT